MKVRMTALACFIASALWAVSNTSQSMAAIFVLSSWMKKSVYTYLNKNAYPSKKIAGLCQVNSYLNHENFLCVYSTVIVYISYR